MTDKKVYPKTPNDVVAYAAAGEELVVTDPSRKVLGTMGAVRIHPQKKVAPPPPPPPPSTDPAGWRLVWDDQFTSWDPSKYWLYGPGWKDTAEKIWPGYGGFYDPANISSDGNKLRCHLWTKNGVPSLVGFSPKGSGPDWPVNAGGWTGLRSCRAEFRIRADRLPLFKSATMNGWCLSDLWPQDGENDILESDFDRQPAAYIHVQGGAPDGHDQFVGSYPAGTSWQDWHTYTSEWRAGVSINGYIDGQLAWQTTNRVPLNPMRFLFQFETSVVQQRPNPATDGYVEIDYLKLWVPA